MGKPTGFMEYTRTDIGHRPNGPSASGTSTRSTSRCRPRTCYQQAARCMDCGIPFCHGTGCPVVNRIPEFNDLVYRGPLARGVGNPALDEQLPGDHRPDLPRPVRGRLHAGHQRRPRHDQAHRATRSPSGRSPRAGSSRAPPKTWPASTWPSSARDPRAWPPPSSSPGPGTRRRSSRRTTASAGCCGTASRTSSWTSASSTAGWSRCAAEGVRVPDGRGRRRGRLRPVPPADVRRGGADHGRRRAARPEGPRARSLTASTSPWSCSPSRTASVGGEIAADAKDNDHRQGQGRRSSSAAATPAATASARQSGRAPRKSTSSRSSPSRRSNRPEDTPWPTWPRILRTSTSHEEGCQRSWSRADQGIHGLGRHASRASPPARSSGPRAPRAGR